MGRRANSLRSYIEGSETDTPASFLTLSVLPDEELFVCIFYFYYFCLIGNTSLPAAACNEFLWYLIKRYKKESRSFVWRLGNDFLKGIIDGFYHKFTE